MLGIYPYKKKKKMICTYQVHKCRKFSLLSISKELRSVNDVLISIGLDPVVVQGIRLFSPVVLIPGDVLLAKDLKDASVVEAPNLIRVGEKAKILGPVTETCSRGKESAVRLSRDGASRVPFVDESVVFGQSVLDRNVIHRESIDSLTGNPLTSSVSEELTADKTVHLGSLHLLVRGCVGSIDGIHIIGIRIFGIIRLHIQRNRLRADLRRVGVRQVQGVAKLGVSNALNLGRVIELTTHVVKRAILLNENNHRLDLVKGANDLSGSEEKN